MWERFEDALSLMVAAPARLEPVENSQIERHSVGLFKLGVVCPVRAVLIER